MEDLPLVSISCITFNHSKYVRQCFDGFLMQKTDFKFEVVVHDDASTDGTKEIIEEYTNKYPDIFFPMYQKENQYSKGVRGIMMRYNIPRCRGKYIAFCEGDDYWIDSFKLQKQFDFMEKNDNYSICFTRFKTLTQDSQIITEDLNSKYFKIDDLFIEFNFEVFAKGWHVGTQTLFFKKDKFDMNSLKNYKYFRDVHLFTELLKKGKGACLNFFGSMYRLHDGGIHTSLSELNVSKTGAICYEELYHENKNILALKQKFFYFKKEYINNLILNFNYFEAFKEVLIFGIQEREYNYLKKMIIYLMKLTLIKFKNNFKNIFNI